MVEMSGIFSSKENVFLETEPLDIVYEIMPVEDAGYIPPGLIHIGIS